MVNHELSSNANLNQFPEIFCAAESVLLQLKKDPADSQHTYNEFHCQFILASYQRKKNWLTDNSASYNINAINNILSQ